MKDLERIDEKEKEHFMKCEACHQWFDMRDLSAVFDHEHWMKEKPEVSFSHAKKKGAENEVYVKMRDKMITLRFAGIKPHKDINRKTTP